jgi:hypothetical protein
VCRNRLIKETLALPLTVTRLRVKLAIGLVTAKRHDRVKLVIATNILNIPGVAE